MDIEKSSKVDKERIEQLEAQINNMQLMYEREKEDTEKYWQNVVDASTKEIEWLKSIINSILRI